VFHQVLEHRQIASDVVRIRDWESIAMKEVVAMTKTYRVTPFVRMGNLFTTVVVRSKLRLGKMSLLTVTGRKSGLPRTVPVAIMERQGQRYLIGAFGEVNWVRNLRASGEATLTRGGITERVSAVEVPPEEAAPILKENVGSAPAFVRAYFDTTPDSPLADFAREARLHPVFRLSPIVGKQFDGRDAA
jgi:deazaflavin-dependent oxidoreductase (nitroreductase family)